MKGYVLFFSVPFPVVKKKMSNGPAYFVKSVSEEIPSVLNIVSIVAIQVYIMHTKDINQQHPEPNSFFLP